MKSGPEFCSPTLGLQAMMTAGKARISANHGDSFHQNAIASDRSVSIRHGLR